MQTEIVIAGFGGQGVLFAGQLLAYAAMDSGKETTWIPSYGPEMRGGTANCTVIVADEEIGAPTVRNPQAVIAMNRPSLDKYEPLVRPGGVLVVNTSMVDRPVERTDIEVVEIPGNEIAERIGDKRMTNMVLLGALLGKLPVLTLESIETALAGHLPERHKKLLPLNKEALQEGSFYRKGAWV
ncbi:MAG TPA: 2-oxoacid:acceptor oxidoreductase family protein [Anaerolineaceae bacterium]|nr:2-oxoacid:acceptor oxidoreductase family protein [Anaerolineaceae bacterium]